MFVLAIDTATPAVTAGVVEVTDTATPVVAVAERSTVGSRRHVEALLPRISECLAQLGLVPADLSAVVTGVGPGPFTGLRVGMATAQAFADAAALPLYGVCSLDAIAYAARQRPADAALDPPVAQPLLVATDARRREVYWARYDTDNRRLGDAAVDTPARLRSLLDSATVQAHWAVGEGAEIYADVLGVPVYPVRYPTCAGLVQGVATRVLGGAPGERPRPLYLRRPDATPQTELRSGGFGAAVVSTGSDETVTGQAPGR